jgi:hypothetical protein
MKLEERLNSALKNNNLYHYVSETTVAISTNTQQVETANEDNGKSSDIQQFENIEQAVEQIDPNMSDEFGVISAIVKSIDENLVLPRKIGNYIVDDVQKTKNGHYEVHLVGDQR